MIATLKTPLTAAQVTNRARALSFHLKANTGCQTALDQPSIPVIKLATQQHIVNLAGLVNSWVVCTDGCILYVNHHGDVLNVYLPHVKVVSVARCFVESEFDCTVL